MSWLPTLRLAAAALALCATLASGQTFPDRPIRFIIPFPPGGSTDFVGRVFAEQWGKVLGQPVVVENRGGAGGTIGADAVAKAAPDGYTVGMSTTSTLAISRACNPTLGYDPLKDFRHISKLVSVSHVIVAHPSFPARTFPEFIALLKSRPATVAYASPGSCAIGHLVMEDLQLQTGTALNHVPYRGAGPALNDVLGGHVPLLIDGLPSSMPMIKAGTLRAIVIAARARSADIPNVPTFADVGYPQMNEPASYGLSAPAGTPDAIVNLLSETAARALKDPAVAARLAAAGAQPEGSTPQQYADGIRRDFERATALVKARNIKP